MFRLSSHELSGCRFIIVEDDDQTARLLELAVRQAGGSVVAEVGTVEEGLREAADTPADRALFHVSYTGRTPLNIPEIFARQGIQTVFVAGHDDWFSVDDDSEGLPERMVV